MIEWHEEWHEAGIAWGCQPGAIQFLHFSSRSVVPPRSWREALSGSFRSIGQIRYHAFWLLRNE
jgi:hypothetical protein